MALSNTSELVLIFDFGAQYAQLIARRVRELNVYSEIVPHRITAAELTMNLRRETLFGEVVFIWPPPCG